LYAKEESSIFAITLIGFFSGNLALKTLENSVRTDEKLWNQVTA